MDGPLYKIGNLIYYSMICNLLFILLAIPGILALVFLGYDSVVGLLAFAVMSSPLGPALTASFYTMRKLQKDESTSPIKDYWKSLKMNFKQSALVWIILAILGIVVYINITSISIMGSAGKYILPFQFLIALELLFAGIYVFPIISKYDNPLKLQLKLALILSNGHLPTTLSCTCVAVILGFVLYYSPAIAILLGVGLYTYSATWLIEKVFLKHWPEKKEDEEDIYSQELLKNLKDQR